MARRVAKILDATTITALLCEIKSVEIIDRCKDVYDLIATEEVLDEIFRSGRLIHSSLDRHFMVESLDHSEFKLMNYLEVRYPALHRGELSSFITAARYAKKCVPSFFVTDDRAMRNSITKMLDSEEFIKFAGTKVTIKSTGTIGLLIHLGEKGHLCKDERERIADDLSTSTFRCTPQLVLHLKND